MSNITWGNRAPAEIHNPRLNRRRTKAEYDKIGEKVKSRWKTDPELKEKASARSKKHNIDQYNVGTYIVRSPGNDLLDFYDQMHAACFDGGNITPVPPSRIFQFRFRTELPEAFGANHASGPTHTSIFREVCAPYADNFDSKKIASDKNKLFKWLVDKPSVQKEFKLGRHAVDYLSEIKGKSQRGLRIVVHSDNPDHEEIFWKGPLAGWSIVFIPN